MDLEQIAISEGFTKLQLNAMMGTLLGDGYVTKPRGLCQKSSLNIQQGLKQQEYTMFKYMILQEFATQQPKVVKNPGLGEFLVRFNLKDTRTLGCLYTMLHPTADSGKTITQEYLNHINHPIALVMWFLDDGNIRHRANNAVISTQGFLESEIDLLVRWLQERWTIACHKQRTITTSGKQRHLICISPEGRTRLMQLIAAYTPKSMLYKVTIRAKACPACGRPMPTIPAPCCSQECSEILEQQSKILFPQELPKFHAQHIRMSRKRWMVSHRAYLSAHTLFARGLISADELQKRLEGPVQLLPQYVEEYERMLARASDLQTLVTTIKEMAAQGLEMPQWVPYAIVPGRGIRHRKSKLLTAEERESIRLHRLETRREWYARLKQDPVKYQEFLRKAAESNKRCAERKKIKEDTAGTK